MQFEGIYTPVVTPHDADHQIDLDRFDQVLEHLIAAGVHGLVIAGTTGEYYVQSPEERFTLMRRAVDVVAGRLPVIVGTGAMRTDDSVMYARAAKEAGADALLVTTPPYAYPTGREIALHALAIDRAANLPVMLYNYPGRMSVEMDEDTLDRLGRSAELLRHQGKLRLDPNRLHLLARDYPAHPAVLRHGRPGAGILRLGRAVMGTCAGSNFAAERAHRALPKPARSTRISPGPPDHDRRCCRCCAMLEQGGKFVQCVKHGMSHARHRLPGRRRAPAVRRSTRTRSASWPRSSAPENHASPRSGG